MGSGLFDEELRNMLMNRAQGPAIVTHHNTAKGANLPANGDLHPAPMLGVSIDPRDLPPGMDVYKDANGRLAVRWERNTLGYPDIYDLITNNAGRLAVGSEEEQRIYAETRTTNTTDLAASAEIQIVRVVLTADANGDILAGDITKATANRTPTLLRFFTPATLAPTSGAAAVLITSDDATPIVWAKGTLAETWENGLNLYGNAATTATGKKWTLTCGGLDAAVPFTFWAWIYVS